MYARFFRSVLAFGLLFCIFRFAICALLPRVFLGLFWLLGCCFAFFALRFALFYRANSIERDSLMTLTLISPGYLSSFSICIAIFRARFRASTSETLSG